MRSKQVSLIIGFISLIIGLFSISIKFDFIDLLTTDSFTFITFSILLVILGISLMLYPYLQGKQSGIAEKIEKDKYDFNKQQLEKIKQEIIIEFSKKEYNIRKEIVDQILEDKIGNISDDIIYDRIEAKYQNLILNEAKMEILNDDIDEVKYNIRNELNRLSRTSNINMILGIGLTISIVIFLGYSLWNIRVENGNYQDYFFHFLPRISLSILVEIFSFFFLKMYKSNIEDIKYYNNERTNLEMKFLAIKSSIIYDQSANLGFLIQEFAKTERNFVLKKGESTVEIEKNRTNSKNSDKLWSNIIKVLGKK